MVRLPVHRASLSRRAFSAPALWMLSGAAALIAAAGAAEQRITAQKHAPRSLPQTAQTRQTQTTPAKPLVRPAAAKAAAQNASQKTGVILLSGLWEHGYDLEAGKVVEISVHLVKPSALPTNGRVAVEWNCTPASATETTTGGTGWRKILHALDGDVYLLYRAPKTGHYTLRLVSVTDEAPVGDANRWREKGGAPLLAALPSQTPWTAGTVAPVAVSVRPVNVGTAQEQETLRTIIECEPNDTPDMAQRIVLTPGAGDEIRTWEITGGADDVEYFDNGRVGQSGDDWFRLEYKGTEPRLLTAQLSLPNQTVAARIRAYKIATPAAPNAPLNVAEYKEGQDQNERVHQQDEEHRANICRLLKPGETCFLRVEANAPGYQLQLRVLPPAPYSDPHLAVRQAVYTQIGQVDAWLTNRPRGASMDRRIRDSGNLLGTQCMSCHTQSGVWGPSVPFANGYRLENVQNYWHLQNVMYECLRPTNEFKDAANNTSLAPLDVGDGPAGTRAAGFNIVNLERIVAPRKLHAKQQQRTANYMLYTADPGGINAAGPGSNVGQVVVYLFATEILKTAWEKTADPKYFRALEEKARLVLTTEPRFTDDIALRLDYFCRVVPIRDFLAWEQKAVQQENGQTSVKKANFDRAAFVEQVKAQLAKDEARLRAIQNPDGTWSFNPGTTKDGGKTWTQPDRVSDPSPTALGVTGLTSAGYGKDDPAIQRGVKALLASQDPTGRWNRAAQTGFVTSAYAMHALSRLYPETPLVRNRADYGAKPNETLLATLKRVQALALTGEPKFADLMVQAAAHTSPLVRYWAVIGLGGTHTETGVPVLVAALGDRAKLVREAAAWALRQTLLDDKGWNATLAAYEVGDDYVREGVMLALNMRADAVLPKANVSLTRLVETFDRAMNRDPHPAVRAWAAKAAWQWWVWNPPVRPLLNTAWLTMLERPEPNAETENAIRYASQALFIVNGHKANGSREHQYKELATLFETITNRLDAEKDTDARKRLARRLVGIGATFYQMAGGDGGPGQMGYITPGSGEMMGKAALLYLNETAHIANAEAAKAADLLRIRIGLEGASNVPYRQLTEFLVNYSLKGPEELRQVAAAAVSDPRVVSLPAVPEQIEPQMAQVKRGAMEPPRRAQVSDPILDLWSKVNWVIPGTEEQKKNFYDLIIPRLDTYVAPDALQAMPDAVRRAQVEREMDAAWYLSDRLGMVLEANPDLHQEIVLLKYFPEKFANPLQAHYWLRNVGWLLTFKHTQMPNLKSAGADVRPVAFRQDAKVPQNAAADPVLAIKDRALQLYLDQLKPTADPRTRALAIRMSNQTALRTNPEVLRALQDALAFEKNEELRKIIQNVLRQGTEKFLPELLAAMKAERNPSVPFDAQGNPQPTKEQIEDILLFRDYVLPEMTRQKRTDQMSCLGCHGLKGRVPSLELRPPDSFGYLSTGELLLNYRILQQRVKLNDLEHSKILRKPLNIQDGKEDGHQGGRRYSPTDEGYLLLKKWVENQPKVQKPAGTGAAIRWEEEEKRLRTGRSLLPGVPSRNG